MIAAVFAAFPQELKHIYKAVHNPTCDVIAVQTGMGAANTETAFRRALRELRPDIVLSIGFGGALYEDAGIGDIVWSSRALLIRGDRIGQHDHQTEDAVPGSDLGRRIGEKLSERAAAREGSIVTLPEMKTKSKIKNVIPSDLAFPVCDMETFFLARLSHQNRMPFLALRAITDRQDEDIPRELLEVTDDGTGRYRLSRAVGLLLRKPKLIPASIRLGMNAARASKSLGKAVDSLVEILPACMSRK